MMNFLVNFSKAEDGAVTVDWVVLTAAVVGLAVAAFAAVKTSTTALTAKTTAFIDLQDPN
jgi:multisubunit Na+/H+ antiporter MnhC subunit